MNTRFKWSWGGTCASAATVRLATLILALMLSCAAPCLSQTFATMPAHASFSLFPWERIDLATMGLTLSFTDFSFPGNAGFEFKVQRVFDPTMQRWRWFVGPEFPFEGGLEWGDGSREVFAVVEQGNCPVSHVMVSSTYGRLVRENFLCLPIAAHLDLPNGQIYYFAAKADNTLLFDHMEDQHGNRVQVYRGVNDRIERAVQQVGSQTREMLFEYYAGSDRLHYLTWNDQRWEYTWSDFGAGLWALTEAKSPAGLAWTFSNRTIPLTVTMPTGGRVTYSFGAVPLVKVQELQFGGGWLSGTRVSSGPDVATLTWTFEWTGNDDPGDPSKYLRRSIVNTPDGARYAEYTHTYGDGDSGLLTKVDVRYGTEVTALEWQKGSIPLQAAIKKVHVQRQNRHYERRFEYDDGCDHYVQIVCPTPEWVTIPNWGQPTKIEETGDLNYSRYTEVIYEQMAYPYADQPRQIDVSGNGEHYATSFSYDPDSAFMLSKTEYGITTSYTPDEYGRVGQEIDGNGYATSYTYKWGVVDSVQTPEFMVTYDINDDGTVMWMRRRGKQTSYFYDKGRLTRVEPPVGLLTSIEYGTAGQPDDGKSVTIRRGTSWKTTRFDAFGRTFETEDDLGVKTRTGYDWWNRVEYQGRPYINLADDKGVTIYRDVLGRIYRVQNADGRSTAWQWYSDPVKITETSSADLSSEHITEQDWKAMGSPSSAWLASETTGAGTEHPQTTSYDYNLLGKLVSVTSPEGMARQWSYFPGTDRLQSVTIPESGIQQWHYDAAGRVDSTTDASQHVTAYEYDGNNRLRFVRPWDTNYTVEMRYDESDNRVWMQNADATTMFDYDDGNRLTKRTDVIAGHTFETIYTPNDYDQVVDIQYPSGNHVSYDYDPSHHQLSRVYDDHRGIVFAHDFAFHPSGAIKSYISGNGITNSTEYDVLSGQLWHAASSSGVLDVQYGDFDSSGKFRVTDNFGNVTKITDSRLGVETFEPDHLNRLKVANGPWGKLEYAYKPVGNRESVTLTRDGAVSTTSYTYDPATNWLTGTSGAQTETLGHDTYGRVTSDRLASLYSYTPSGLLETAMMRASVQQEYRYNADDERVLKIVGGGQSRTYLVNGLSEFSTDGGPIGWTVDYLYAGSRLLGAVRPAPGSVYTLRVTKPGDGAGLVSALPAGLDCGPDCEARYVGGTTVMLTATPEAASYFTGWGGACGGTATTIYVTIDAVKDCTATFVPIYDLTVLKTGEGSAGSFVTSTPPGIACEATCAASFVSGTPVQLTVVPATGYELAFWQGDGCSTGTVTMTGARTCTAWFQPIVPPCNPTPTQLSTCRSRGGRWDYEMCACRFGDLDPLVLTLDGAPIHLTGLAGGVALTSTGTACRSR
jgi:YD repeat-containing protein